MVPLWVILTLSSAFFSGFKDILTKKLFRKNISSSQIIFEEYLLLFLVVFLLFFNKINFISIYDLWYLYLLKAFSISSFSIIYLKLLRKYDISLITPLMNLSPLILLILSYIFLGEVISSIQLIGIFVIIISTYFLEVTLKNHDNKNPHKLHFINLKNRNWKFFIQTFSMLLIISITAISDRLILSKVDVYTNIFFASSIILIILFFYYIKERILIYSIKSILNEPETFLIAVLTNVSTFFILIAISLPFAILSLVIPLKRTSTLFSSLIGGLLFHESHLKQKMFATSGMLIGVLLIVY